MADRLDLDELRELVAKELERWRAPGLELAVVLDGEVVTAEGFGLRDLAAGLPVTPHTLFHHGSTGKAFTSFLVGTLVDEGLLGWDRPVREYIPDLAFGDEAIGSRVTVRDLLSHRSGLPRHEWVWLANPGWPRSELVRRLRHLEMSRDLRQSFQYSNLGYVAAGYLAGQVAGSDWETSMDERVFAPLGMSRTLTSVERARSSDDFARPYALVDGEVRALPYRPSDPIAPAGQVLSCAQDMARWLLCHTTDGSGAISPGALREMHTVQMGTGPALDNPSMPHIRFHGYGLGWVVGTYRGQDWVFHNGAMDGFRTEMAVLPSVRAGVVVCANFTHTSGLPFALLQHVMDRILALEPGPWLDEAFERDARMREAEQGTEQAREARKVPGTEPAHPLESYAGRYDHDGYGSLHVTVGGDRLAVRLGEIDMAASHRHFDTWDLRYEPLNHASTLTFLTHPDGEVSEAWVPLESQTPPIRFRRAADGRLRDPGFLSGLAGRYAMGPVTLDLTQAEGVLKAQVAGQPALELEPSVGLSFVPKGLPAPRLSFTLREDGRAGELFVEPGGLFTRVDP